MTAELRIRAMLPGDLPFADSLRGLAGWNQTFDDWRRFLAMQPDGCFLAEWDGAPAGTATTTVYGPGLGWIGMVLVHPQFRRRGIGRSLLLTCIQHLQTRGVRCIKLDATPEGRLVYKSLGFADEWTLRRWDGDVSAVPRKDVDARIRPWTDADAERLDPLDSRAFGVSRRELIIALERQSSCALVYESQPGVAAGFGMVRPGARASYLGPVSATSSQSGMALVEALMSHAPGRVFWDVPDVNGPAAEWAQRSGLGVQRSLTRMWLGEACVPGLALHQFALAGPELG